MEIQVKLYASLRKFGPKGLSIGEAFAVHGQSGWTIADLVNSLNIPLESAKIVMVDGIHRKLDFALPDSPVLVAIFPPIGGG
ncbi:MAG: MoaD/ThiS family protein [Candidatus Thorarchaeota archaeon]